jgi:hypothetical protein
MALIFSQLSPAKPLNLSRNSTKTCYTISGSKKREETMAGGEEFNLAEKFAYEKVAYKP